MAHQFHHIHVKSADPRASAGWWADMFGAAILPESEFGAMLFAPVELDGIRINITSPDPSEGTREVPAIPHYGLEHLGLLTKDLDGDLARFAQQGLPIYERRPGAGGYEIAFVGAPDGVCLELLQLPGDE
ncbi:MAG: VOC family protein [Actinobacteria bacterium]|nr:VOC family protein [Actinomycetota bacterium]MBU1493708.1 VOC family protein [Actinomycetota bacterium]MBU1865833.1 VOC family protein [Actinomycetota bacterium]